MNFLKVKGRHLYTATYMNMTSSGLQCEVVAMTLGGTAQVAAAHCPNERTLDPAVCSYNRPTEALDRLCVRLNMCLVLTVINGLSANNFQRSALGNAVEYSVTHLIMYSAEQ